MIRKLYDFFLEKAASKYAERWLAAVSFADSIFLPIPPDIMLMPMIIADRSKTWRLAAIVTITSIIGAIIGYILGAYFYEAVAQPLIEAYHYEEEFKRFSTLFEEYGILIVLAGGLTPIPFKVVAISCGVIGMNPLIFLLSLIPARLPRFYIEAILLWYFGEPIREFVEKRLVLMFTLFVVVLVGGIIGIKYI
ncbi:YqaA family protein [Temperatibacter marinus]|uniref:YqaA family protein n=1 Tax=Temperatibacter marinus TaxID=1456591 RepID=A0AA52HAM4_9PROT|nr:YqaA family protein [Temperatibacter marinus]WND03757.1 YqaA family protein [Temperatibacter marinus]